MRSDLDAATGASRAEGGSADDDPAANREIVRRLRRLPDQAVPPLQWEAFRQRARAMGRMGSTAPPVGGSAQPGFPVRLRPAAEDRPRWHSAWPLAKPWLLPAAVLVLVAGLVFELRNDRDGDPAAAVNHAALNAAVAGGAVIGGAALGTTARRAAAGRAALPIGARGQTIHAADQRPGRGRAISQGHELSGLAPQGAYGRAGSAERWLQSQPPPAIVYVGTQMAVTTLEDRLASMDDQLNAVRLERPHARQVVTLQRDRAQMLESLAQVRYAQSLVAGLP